MIKDLISMVGNLVNSMKEMMTQMMLIMKPAQTTPPATQAPVDAGATQGGGASNGAASPEGNAPVTKKDKILKLISDLVDLFTDSGSVESKAAVQADGGAKTETEGKKKGGFFGSLLHTVTNFGKKFFEKKGADAIASTLEAL
jgi:hypothetical protein